jgi:nitrite reductase (NO-forming)
VTSPLARDVHMQDRSQPRRCRRRVVDPSGPRPSALLAVFFAAGLAFAAAGAGAGLAFALTGAAWLHWVALHLLFVGGVSQLVLGAGQFFTCAFLATSPTPRWLVQAQLAVWNIGTLFVAVGVPTGVTLLSDVGGGLVAVGLVLFAGALRGMQRRSLQQARWAVRWYQACAACLGIGVLVGIAMARGTPWPYGSLLGAHLALNLAGWIGTAIVGTLHTFFPSLTQTRLRLPRLQGPTFALWLLGVAGLAIGTAFDGDAVVASGWLALAVATGLLSTNLLASLSAAPGILALPARLVALGQLWLPAGVSVALAATVTGGAAAPFAAPVRGALAVLFLAGWIGLTVGGALLHLLAVLARVRRFAIAMPEPRAARDRIVVSAAATGIGALALANVPGLERVAGPAAVLTVMVALGLGVRIAVLAARAIAVRPRHPREVRGRPA